MRKHENIKEVEVIIMKYSFAKKKDNVRFIFANFKISYKTWAKSKRKRTRQQTVHNEKNFWPKQWSEQTFIGDLKRNYIM